MRIHELRPILDWLNANRNPNLTLHEEHLLRIMKLTEEVGEVNQAVIGAEGQNPRKGFTHTWADVEKELCDVIVTAMVALHTLNPDGAQDRLDRHLDHLKARIVS